MADIASRSLALRAPKQPFVLPDETDAVDIFLQGDDSNDPISVFEDGSATIEHADGTITVDFNPDLSPKEDTSKHDANLAKGMSESELMSISSDILTGIDNDETSRKDWLDMRARGIVLLGLKLEEPRGDTGTSSAPLEGMSTIRHPLLLEASIAFQAGARGELLPAEGPLKVRNDNPPAPPPGQGAGNAPLDELAEALQKDLNHYLTHTAREYVPDTDRMLFMCPFSGDGFKKIYHCPLRRRPVSESVDAENMIISNMATDIHNCGRITHKIRMRKSVLRRMQIVGAYRDIDLLQATAPTPTAPEQRKAEIGGYKPTAMRPEDEDYTIYECYTELELDEFAPKQFKGKGLPLPYRITIEKDSHQVLDLRRNWDEDDPECQPRQFFVQFPFIRGLGFYGLGFVHLLGNAVVALTAAWREMIDAGMFANFPGFIYAKQAGRQLTNQFRVAPGGGIGLDLPAGMRIQDVAMPMPYKEVGPAFPAFIQHIEEASKQTAMTSNPQVGEGKQDAPVGTTLALLEQATKIVSSAFKRLHTSQSEEFELLKQRFREDPEAMWRNNKKPAMQWQKDQFLQALDKYELVPCADPNNPTSLHRVMKAMAVKQLQTMNPQLYDPVAVDKRIMSVIGIDSEGLFKPPPPPGQPPPPDPMMIMMQMRMQLEQLKVQAKAMEIQLKKQIADTQAQSTLMDVQGKQKIENTKAAIQQNKQEQDALISRLKIVSDEIMHHHEMQDKHAERQHQMGMQQHKGAMEAHLAQQDHAHDQQQAHVEHQYGMQQAHTQAQLGMQQEHLGHQHALEQGHMQQQHETQREQMGQQHEAQQAELGHQHEMRQTQMGQRHEAKMGEREHEHEAETQEAEQEHKTKEAAMQNAMKYSTEAMKQRGGAAEAERQRKHEAKQSAADRQVARNRPRNPRA